MGNEISGLVPNDKERSNGKPAQPAWLGTSMNNISFGGNAVSPRTLAILLARVPHLVRMRLFLTVSRWSSGLQEAMRSFDERGGGRRVAANLADDAFGSFEDDTHDADDLGGGTHDWGVDDAQKEAAPNEAAVNKQQANRGDFDEENPKVLPTVRHATRAHLACLETCRCAVRCAP
jgi:hypothetical protein